MTEDRDKEREEGQKRPSRPVTAAARRERRGTARPAGRADAGEGKAAEKSTAPKSKPKPAEKSDASDGDKKGRPTRTRDQKEKRPSPPARLMRFLREVVAELRKVIWPTRKQMITYTAVVLVFVAFMMALVGVLDLGLAKGVFALFG